MCACRYDSTGGVCGHLNELWNLTLHPPFLGAGIELAAWASVRRRPLDGTYVIALRNGPPSSQRHGHSRLTHPLSAKVKPGSLIGHNGFIVTDLGPRGARVSFIWCTNTPGTARRESRLQSSLAHFPRVARSLVEHAVDFAPLEAQRRAELVDTTGDGRVDSLGVDVTGDGVVDTMIHLSGLPATPGAGPSRPGSSSRKMPTPHAVREGSRRQFSQGAGGERSAPPQASVVPAVSRTAEGGGTASVAEVSAAPARTHSSRLRRVQSRSRLQHQQYDARAEREDHRDFFMKGALSFFNGM